MAFLLTVEYLRDVRKACAPQVALFEAEFPAGMEWTRENLQRCVEIGMTIEWYALRSFPRDKAREYLAAITDAKESYDEAREALQPILDAVNTRGVVDMAAVNAATAQFVAALAPATLAYSTECARVMFEVAADHEANVDPYSERDTNVFIAESPERIGVRRPRPAGFLNRLIRATGRVWFGIIERLRRG